MNVQRAPDKSNERRKAHKRWEQGQMAKEEPGHSLNMQGYVGRVKDHLELNLQGMWKTTRSASQQQKED